LRINNNLGSPIPRPPSLVGKEKVDLIMSLKDLPVKVGRNLMTSSKGQIRAGWYSSSKVHCGYSMRVSSYPQACMTMSSLKGVPELLAESITFLAAFTTYVTCSQQSYESYYYLLMHFQPIHSDIVASLSLHLTIGLVEIKTRFQT